MSHSDVNAAFALMAGLLVGCMIGWFVGVSCERGRTESDTERHVIERLVDAHPELIQGEHECQ